MHLLRVLAPLLLVTGSIQAQGKLWVVDSLAGPGHDFTQISDAVENCIFWNNQDSPPSDQEIFVNGQHTPELRYTDLAGGVTSIGGTGTVTLGPGVIDLDPRFANPAAGDDHLSAGSPCIDADDPAFVGPTGDTDLDGDPRPLGAAVDLGSDEQP
ncbi:MAG: hypothetical protein AAF682_31595 [Planctomycetota bacterium]